MATSILQSPVNLDFSSLSNHRPKIYSCPLLLPLPPPVGPITKATMSYYASSRKPVLRSRLSPELESSPASSTRAVTPPGGASSASSSTFLTASVSNLWGGLVRRFSAEPSSSTPAQTAPSLPHAKTFQPDGDSNGGVYSLPHHHILRSHRTASPMRPPPLEPLQLLGFSDDTRADARLLTVAIAEEIRLMVPARLSIVDEWKLVYSLEQDGASLSTLYERCARYQGKRVGFVLCVKDCEGGVSASRSHLFSLNPSFK
jgi:hypothetical protein